MILQSRSFSGCTAKGNLLGGVREVVRTEPHADPAGHCLMATDQRQIQTCSVGYVHAVVKVTVQHRAELE